MLFYVKSTMKTDKVGQLSEMLSSGGFPQKARHVFASLDDHHVGLTFWEADDKESFEELRKMLEDYIEIHEVIPVVSAEDVYVRSLQDEGKKQGE